MGEESEEAGAGEGEYIHGEKKVQAPACIAAALS